LYAGGAMCAQVWVKMKFKNGRVTVPPSKLFGAVTMTKPAYILAWDAALLSTL
jgi:hypothetical protein